MEPREVETPAAAEKSGKWNAPRLGEKIGGGFFVFRRHSTSGRIAPSPHGRPFEHETLTQALDEARRLAIAHPGKRFSVFQEAGTHQFGDKPAPEAGKPEKEESLS